MGLEGNVCKNYHTPRQKVPIQQEQPECGALQNKKSVEHWNYIDKWYVINVTRAQHMSTLVPWCGISCQVDGLIWEDNIEKWEIILRRSTQIDKKKKGAYQLP